MVGKEVEQMHAHSTHAVVLLCPVERKKDKKELKENQMEEDYSIATKDKKTSDEEGEQEVPGVHGPPTHSGLGNICSGIGRD